MFLGHLAGAIGRYDEAEEHFIAATEMHDRMKAPLLIARTHLYRGEARLNAGNINGAQPFLQKAREIAEPLGGAAIARRAAELLGA
jgi:tetratricopeptide (TPR) repeat protein